MQTFTWFPDTDSTCDTKTNVVATKFGDGYEARTPRGLNYIAMNWALKFTRDRVEAMEVITFLRQQGGHKAFIWSTPLGESGYYVCREWSSLQRRGLTEVTAKFEQVFSTT